MGCHRERIPAQSTSWPARTRFWQPPFSENPWLIQSDRTRCSDRPARRRLAPGSSRRSEVAVRAVDGEAGELGGIVDGAVAVGPGSGSAPPFVPSHVWVPAVASSRRERRSSPVRRRPVLVRPSTRRFTVTGKACAAGAATSADRTSAAGALYGGVDRTSSHPFLGGRMGFRPEEGLLASSSAPRLPGEPSAAQWLHATHQRPFTVAGPRGIHTRLP